MFRYATDLWPMLKVIVNPGVELGDPSKVNLSNLRVYSLMDLRGAPLVQVRLRRKFANAGWGTRASRRMAGARALHPLPVRSFPTRARRRIAGASPFSNPRKKKNSRGFALFQPAQEEE